MKVEVANFASVIFKRRVHHVRFAFTIFATFETHKTIRLSLQSQNGSSVVIRLYSRRHAEPVQRYTVAKRSDNLVILRNTPYILSKADILAHA